jgi:enoyl-CoA hydratase/carnithine racemase
MSNVMIEERDQVALLRLTNGVTNAISPEFVDDFSDALKRIRKEFKGMVLAGGNKFFSIGLDLPSLLKLDRSEMTVFWDKFNDITFDLFTVPFPTICAVEGHAIAGGTVFALCYDYRFGADKEKKLGLNEIKLGVPVPYLPDLLLRQLVGDRAATRMLYYGNFVSMSEAKEIQLVDKLFTTEDLEEESLKEAALLAAMPGPALVFMKRNRIEEIRIRYEKNIEEKSREFLDCWFSAPVQELLEKASENF